MRTGLLSGSARATRAKVGPRYETKQVAVGKGLMSGSARATRAKVDPRYETKSRSVCYTCFVISGDYRRINIYIERDRARDR